MTEEYKPTFSEREDDENIIFGGKMKKVALQIAEESSAKDFAITSIKSKTDINGLVGDMRYVEGGQQKILKKILEEKPGMTWYRGGGLVKWSDVIATTAVDEYTKEELDTYVLDGSGYGALNRPELAKGYIKNVGRPQSVLYKIKAESLIDGLNEEAIRISGVHGYDIEIQPGKDRHAYLKFCKENLEVEKIASATRNDKLVP